MTRLSQLNRQNLKWVGRMMLILVLVALLDGLVVYFVPKPFFWATMIPALIPILTSIFIIFPMGKATKSDPPSA